jgi:hypothetical protein
MRGSEISDFGQAGLLDGRGDERGIRWRGRSSGCLFAARNRVILVDDGRHPFTDSVSRPCGDFEAIRRPFLRLLNCVFPRAAHPQKGLGTVFVPTRLWINSEERTPHCRPRAFGISHSTARLGIVADRDGLPLCDRPSLNSGDELVVRVDKLHRLTHPSLVDVEDR